MQMKSRSGCGYVWIQPPCPGKIGKHFKPKIQICVVQVCSGYKEQWLYEQIKNVCAQLLSCSSHKD